MIARGNRRATIFHDEADCHAYLDRLERYRHRDGVTLHAYVLMINHVHLLGDHRTHTYGAVSRLKTDGFGTQF